MSLSDEFQKRMAVKPDQWTLAWWEERFQDIQKGYRGATHAINCAAAELEDAQKKIDTLRESIASLEADRAKIGELQARVDKMAEFLTQLKKERERK